MSRRKICPTSWKCPGLQKRENSCLGNWEIKYFPLIKHIFYSHRTSLRGKKIKVNATDENIYCKLNFFLCYRTSRIIGMRDRCMWMKHLKMLLLIPLWILLFSTMISCVNFHYFFWCLTFHYYFLWFLIYHHITVYTKTILS